MLLKLLMLSEILSIDRSKILSQQANKGISVYFTKITSCKDTVLGYVSLFFSLLISLFFFSPFAFFFFKDRSNQIKAIQKTFEDAKKPVC